MVDLRCHGESATIGSLPGEPHTVQTSAGDVLALLRQLRLFPEVLVGHSFGGKVVMSMAEQFGSIASRLPRPVQVLTSFFAVFLGGSEEPLIEALPLPVQAQSTSFFAAFLG